jgi:hypothetical protein
MMILFWAPEAFILQIDQFLPLLLSGIFRGIDGQDVKPTGDSNKWEHHT